MTVCANPNAAKERRVHRWPQPLPGHDSRIWYGAEKFHSAMLPVAGEGSQIYRDVCELGSYLHDLADVVGSKVTDSPVAVVYDVESIWASEHTTVPNRSVEGWREPLDWFGAFAEYGIRADVTPVHGDWDTHDVVVIPCVYLFDDATAMRLRDFVARGGKAIVTYYSAIADEHDRLFLGGWPGLIGDVAGVRIEEHCPLGDQFDGALDHLDVSNGAVVHDLADVITSVAPDTRVVATFEADEMTGMNGRPAITVHPYGEGMTGYVGGRLGKDGIVASLPQLFDAMGMFPDAVAADGDVLRVTRAQTDGTAYEFVFNRRRETVTVDVPHGETAIAYRAQSGGGTAVLQPNGAIVIRR